MKIKWSTEAKQNYFDTLDYWEEHNASYEYPLKIIRAVELTEIEIAENPYFLAKYHRDLNLYKRSFLNNQFVIYYEVKEEENVIEIQHFRGARQEPLF